jgi:hypothetical protein
MSSVKESTVRLYRAANVLRYRCSRTADGGKPASHYCWQRHGAHRLRCGAHGARGVTRDTHPSARDDALHSALHDAHGAR